MWLSNCTPGRGEILLHVNNVIKHISTQERILTALSQETHHDREVMSTFVFPLDVIGCHWQCVRSAVIGVSCKY